MYTEQQLAELVASVEKEFNAELAKAEALGGEALAKAEDAPPAKEDEKSEEKAPEEKPAPKADGEEKAPEAKEAEAKPEGQEAAPAAEGDEANKPAPEAQAANGDACDYDEEDLEHMHKMYSSMSKGELKAHHDACRKALDGHGMEKCGEMQMAKSEETVIAVPANVVNPEVETLKAELAAQMAKSEELKKINEGVTTFLTQLVKKTAPQGKAITNLDAIAKSEGTNEEKTLTKSEVTEILKNKDYSKLSKSDRDAINSFYLGSGSINSINHLLK